MCCIRLINSIAPLWKNSRFSGLSFPKIRNLDENRMLVNFLRMTIFDKEKWSSKFAKSHNIPFHGKTFDYKNDLNTFVKDKSVLLDGFSTTKNKWIDSDGAELNFTNWGIGHPAQRNYVTLILLK